MTARTRTAALVAATVVAILSVAVIVYILRVLKPESQDSDSLSESDSHQLIEAKNVGLAHLENHDTARSTPIFSELAATIPEEPLGARNLAVSLIVAMGEDYQHATPQLIDQARTALELAGKREGATAEWRWLSARLAMAAKDFAAAEAHLVKIVEDRPQNASAWFELFQVRQASDDRAQRGRAGSALDEAFRLRPGNLFVLVEYLRQLEARFAERHEAIERLSEDKRPAARRRAIEEHGDLAASLRQIRETLEPFRDRLVAISRIDVVQLIDEALAAAESADTRELAERAGQVARLTLGIAATDLNQIRKHTLEFVVDRFTPEFYERHGLRETEPPPAIDVSFAAPQPLELVGELQDKLEDIKSVSVADFDLDGRPDVIVLDASGVHVFARADDGRSRERIASAPLPGGMTGLVVQDFDLDFDETPQADTVPGPRSQVPGQEHAKADEVARNCPSADVDVIAFGSAGVMVLKNRYAKETGQRSLMAVEQPFDELRGVRAATAADLDADGDLDLILATENDFSLWSNRGNATFEDISVRSSLPPRKAVITGLLAVDWDHDIDVDVIMSSESHAGWLQNMRHGQMRWHEFADDLAALRSARAFDLVDADGNSSWDLLATTEKGIQLVRTRTPTSGTVRPLEIRQVSDFAARKLRAFDYDNDGLLDLLAWDEKTIAIYRGLPEGLYRAVDLVKSPPASIRDCDIGDLDADGDLDLIVAGSDRVAILSNIGGNKNHWLDVSLKARQIKGAEVSASGRVNAQGVGSLLEIKAGTHYQPAVVRGQTTHFGLGPRRSADALRVMWLNGVPQNVVQPAADQAICELQVLTGSCPYLYSWNGAKFEFITDLLWAAPLGLQAAEGVLLPAREWEYIKIPGDKLAARNGEYSLQITEELWEAAYFDEVKLITVDHPAKAEIFSNEKVGPAEIAQFKVHMATARKQPIAARNHRGRDLLAEIAHGDGIYTKPFDVKLRQGLVEAHFIELDLGELDNPKHVTLFLTGWIYPSGTSINVAVSQNPQLPQPKPPALLVPDGSGGWEEVLPYMGFPGGKTKTIAIDLSGIFPSADYRVRIATNLELYWDQIFFTVDEPAVEVRLTELHPQSADLHWRGFSQIVDAPGYGPERFVYDRVTREPKWPPMQGRFTRYGDVTDLVRTCDDRLLVLGAGDEVTLRFKAIPDPPPGWKRDFLLYSVGWDKDANLCTVLGQTVEPLPFAAMRGYPPLPDDRPPDSAKYQGYLRTYQTRVQNHSTGRPTW